MQTVNVRRVNQWLKTNVPFWARCERSRDGFVVSAEPGSDLRPYAGRLAAEFGVNGICAYGHPNYLTIPKFV